jgi:purine-binding chemotaxis protein CheW
MKSEQAGAGLLAAPRQVLTFSVGTEHYGVDILRVQEIRGWSPVTKIPKLPPQVLGVLNLRGSIVPILDLRIKFNLTQAEFTPLTVIIVLSVESADGPREFGLVVDAVRDVVDIAPDHLKDTPSLGGRSPPFIQGLAALGERMLILLNVDELINRDMEQVTLDAVADVA